MTGADESGTPHKILVLVGVAMLAVAVFALGSAVSGTRNGPSSVHERPQHGYTFVYHPDATVTVVKQELTQHGNSLTVIGPSGSVGWTNASGGSTNVTALFDRKRLGATPGSRLRIEERIGPNATVPVANSTVPARPRNASFVMAFHQEPVVTVVNVYPRRTNASTLALVGPKGSVAWYNATNSTDVTARTTSFTSTPKSATFVYDGHALGAAAGDNVTLVRVDPETGTRTMLLTRRIP